MAINNFIVKFSGTIAYADGSLGHFDANAIWKGSLGGVINQNNLQDSQFHFKQLLDCRTAEINSVLDLLPNKVRFR